MTETPYDATPYDTPADTEDDGDQYAIEPLLLPSGVKVEFRSMAKLTADNVKWLRGADDREGQMAYWNEMHRRAIHLLVDGWTLTEANGRPVPIPRSRQGTELVYLKHLAGIDLPVLERHLGKAVERLFDRGDSAGE